MTISHVGNVDFKAAHQTGIIRGERMTLNNILRR